ncbi:MAG: DUF58 domain-containing protein [Lysobacter sp.]|nr:DUF58 domain-containing protein [Lysobacter sp.]
MGGPAELLRWHAWALRLTRPHLPETVPARLDRRRVYLLPTRFGLFYSFALMAMLLGALNYNNNPALLLAMVFIGAGIASLIATQMQLTGLGIAAIHAEPVAAGMPLQLRVHATASDARRRRGLRVNVEPAPERSALLNLDHGFGEAELPWPTTQRGWLQLPRLRISTTRPLGLARAWAYVWPQTPLLVYPAPETGGPPLPLGSGDRAQSRLHPTGDDVHHLRSYRNGDSRRAIAWKASARRDALLVREYEQPLGSEVLLDWHSLARMEWEARIARLARWVDEAECDGRRYRLTLPGQPSIGPAQGATHRHACLRALALLPHG